MNPLAASAIVSIMLNPVLYRLVGPAEAFLERQPRLWRLLNPRSSRSERKRAEKSIPAHRALVVGYGPIGEAVVRLLKDRGIEPTIIEMNIDTYRRLRTEELTVVHGDANRSEVLEEAGFGPSCSSGRGLSGFHSWRSAIVGSVLAARVAGT